MCARLEDRPRHVAQMSYFIFRYGPWLRPQGMKRHEMTIAGLRVTLLSTDHWHGVSERGLGTWRLVS
jgi:hypothetical protein